MPFFETVWMYATSGIIGWVVVIGIAYFLLTKYIFKKGTLFLKNRKTEMIVLLIAGVVVTGAFSVGNLFSVGGGGTTGGVTTDVAGLECQQPGGGNTNSVLVNARNKLNIAQDYNTNTATLVYTDGGESASSALTGGTKTYVTFASAPCKTGSIYLLSSTSQNGLKSAFDSYSLTKNYDLLNTNSSRLVFTLRNNAYTSIAGTASPQTANITSQALGQGGSVTYYMDIEVNETGSSQFGSADGGFVFAVDNQDTTVWAKDDVSITGEGVSSVACSNYPGLESADSADICFKSPAITSGHGLYRYTLSIKASLGEPSNDNLVIYAEDVNYARDTDGSIKLLTKDTANADIGESQGSLTLNFS